MGLAAILRSIWATCLLIAATNHAQVIWRHGLLWDYGGVPMISRWFWTSLTFADSLAAILLFIKPRLGIALTVIIIVTDVVHNGWLLRRDHSSLWNWMFSAQFAFLVFVLLSARAAWRGTLKRPLPAE